MEHKYIGMKNFIETATSLKESLIDIYSQDVSLQQFRKIFEDLNLVVDDGHYDVFILHKKSHLNFNKSAEQMAVSSISISDLYYEILRDKPEMLNNVSASSALSSASLKEKVYNKLKEYRDNYEDIKSIPSNNIVGNLKKSMFINAYEKIESDISKIFNEYGITSTYENNKAIIKSAKYIEKYPITVFVNVNNLVSRIIHDSQILDNNSKDSLDTKDIQIDKKNKKRGIFLA